MTSNHQDERDAVVEAHAGMVWRIALSRARREDAAEEVFQETFLRLFEKERSFDSEEHRKAWLINTTLVCCKRYLSSAYQHAAISLEELSGLLSLPEEDCKIAEAMFELPDKYRLPLQLYYMEGMTAEECARVLNLRLGTFRVRLTRGKERLRKILKGEGIDV